MESGHKQFFFLENSKVAAFVESGYVVIERGENLTKMGWPLQSIEQLTGGNRG